MRSLSATIAEEFDAVSLAELEQRAELGRRLDRKYVISREILERLLPKLAESHAVLEIGGVRTFGYRNVYFDSDSLLTYREHVQRRRRRFKCRSRHYVDSDLHKFEVKLKGCRGQTVKERCSSTPELYGILATPSRAFLRECLRSHYGKELDAELRPTLHMRYRRITLVGLDAPERVTIDIDLRFAGQNGVVAAMTPDWAIVESKSAHGRATLDRLLRTHRVRPIDCSKYCLGITLTRPEVRGNPFLWLARRHFQRPQPVSLAETAQALDLTVDGWTVPAAG
jgi:hypothetical protein